MDSDGGFATLAYVRISKIFKGFEQQRVLFMTNCPWDGSACDRALIAPDRFLEYMDEVIIEKVDDYNNGPWEVLRARVCEVVTADKYNNPGTHFIDIEN